MASYLLITFAWILAAFGVGCAYAAVMSARNGYPKTGLGFLLGAMICCCACYLAGDEAEQLMMMNIHQPD